jgi:hypothetical protein
MKGARCLLSQKKKKNGGSLSFALPESAYERTVQFTPGFRDCIVVRFTSACCAIEVQLAPSLGTRNNRTLAKAMAGKARDTVGDLRSIKFHCIKPERASTVSALVVTRLIEMKVIPMHCDRGPSASTRPVSVEAKARTERRLVVEMNSMISERYV